MTTPDLQISEAFRRLLVHGAEHGWSLPERRLAGAFAERELGDGFSGTVAALDSGLKWHEMLRAEVVAGFFHSLSFDAEVAPDGVRVGRSDTGGWRIRD